MKQTTYSARLMRVMTLLSLVVFAGIASARAQTTAFTYQGRLTDGAAAANGTYDFEFALYDADDAQIGATETRENVVVTNGAFTVQLDFGATPFSQTAARTLEISVRRGTETGAFTALSPRQPITAAPYAIQATTADTSTNALNVDGTPADQIIKEGDARLNDERTPIAGSANYVQNTTTEQASTDFNISGNGTANVFDAKTQFNIGGSRVLTAFGSNLSIGLESGTITPATGISNIFIGPRTGASNTTGNSNLFFGQDAGQSNTTGSYNLFFGISTGLNSTGSYNSFFGGGAGFYNLTGNYNTFIGYAAGITPVNNGNRNTLIGTETRLGSGNLNYATAIGAGAAVFTSNTIVLGRIEDTVKIPGSLNVNTFSADTLSANTLNAAQGINLGGSRFITAPSTTTNTAVGFLAGNTGTQNSFFGYGAGSSNVTGLGNSFFGKGTGAGNTSGEANSFFGLQAGHLNTTGSNNSFFGLESGFFNSTGGNNSFFGMNAGRGNRTGSNNTIIGFQANVGAINLTFASAFGAGAVVSTSNTIVLGRADGSDKIRIFGLGAAGSTALCRNADNEISTCAPVNLTEENRVNTEQINALRRQVEQQEKILERQQILIDALKKIVCANNPNEQICN